MHKQTSFQNVPWPRTELWSKWHNNKKPAVAEKGHMLRIDMPTTKEGGWN